MRGYDAGKKVNGRKRHVLVDVMGLLLMVVVHAANIHDRDGAKLGLANDEDDFDFNERFTALKAEFEEQLKEEVRLNALIAENLKKVKLL